MMYDINVLKKISNEEWKAAARRGAEYILEMNVQGFFTFGGSMCAMIGLLTGAGPRMLFSQNWIDEIIISCSNKYPIRVIGNIVNSRDMEGMTSATAEEIWTECVRREIYPSSAKMTFISKFPFEQNLGEIYDNPQVM
jgi:hypothetical protein